MLLKIQMHTLTDKETVMLIRLLQGKQTSSELTGLTSTEKLIKAARKHRVSHFLFNALKKAEYLSSDLQFKALETFCLRAAGRSLVQAHELKKICLILNREAIGFTVIKGTSLSAIIYGKDVFKTSTDLDIMLHKPSDFQHVHRILEGAEYFSEHMNKRPSLFKRNLFLLAKREAYYVNRRQKCLVDLHIRPGANTYLTRKYFREFFKDLRSYNFEGIELFIPSNEKYLVYLCYHGALHQFSKLVWLMDIRAFIRNIRLNTENIKKEAQAIHAERSLVLALYLMKQYFNDEIPEDLKLLVRPSWRIKMLAGICTYQWDKTPEYPFSVHARCRKFIYIMLLIKGLAGRIDYIIGIFLRFIVKAS